MALPFLPGNNFSQNVGKTKFHRSHHFYLVGNEQFYAGESKPGIGGEPRPNQELPPIRPEMAFARDSTLPSWLTFDRQVLSFSAYYHESVQEQREETYRIHECMIYFHLEDDTIEIISIKRRNSRLNQGTIVHRHRIPKPAPHHKEFYTIDDFNIGVKINIYGKVFKIVNCDHFTYKFLYKSGVKIPNPAQVPMDPYTEFRKAIDEAQMPLRPYKRIDTLKKFLEHDMHVLRFYCTWDDTPSESGIVHKCILFYFLSDDTMEVREVFPPNCGQEMGSVLGEHYVNFPGKICDRTMLNVFGSVHKDNRFIYDGLQIGEVNIPYYSAEDLRLGDIISVYGRPLKLCNCDEFTKNFYKTKYGIVEFTPLEEKEVPEEPTPLTYPPYNGFGSEEDSMQNCYKIVIQAKQSNFLQFLKYDKEGFNSRVLRFLGKMVTKNITTTNEEFIISFYLSDDTIKISMHTHENTDTKINTFLSRTHVKLPGQEKFNIEPMKYYSASDFRIGAIVELNEYEFQIIDADEYTFRYMESHMDKFPQANIMKILQKLKNSLKVTEEPLAKAFMFRDADSSNYVTFKDMLTIFAEFEFDINEHELITIGRFFNCINKPSMNVYLKKVITLTQEQLRKAGYDDMKDLLRGCLNVDREKTGRITAATLRRVLFSHNIPLKKHLLQQLIDAYPKDDEGNIFYEEFLRCINWIECPQSVQVSQLVDPSLLKDPSAKIFIEKINYRELLESMFPQKHDNGDLECNEKTQETTELY